MITLSTKQAMLATVFLVGNVTAVCGPGEDYTTPVADYDNTCDAGVCVVGRVTEFSNAQGLIDEFLADEGDSIMTYWMLVN